MDEIELPVLLDSFTQWKYPKGDLFQWVELLDKFDSILERLCKQYALQTVQRDAFHAQDKSLLVAILRISVFLLDHCANRTLYSSANVRGHLFQVYITLTAI